MSEAPKAKEKDPTAWGTYFETEFKRLKFTRGILQFEKLSDDEYQELCGLMVLECQKPPYNEIEKVVIQRVISDAVVNDPDFIGFNVAWIRKTLNKWWDRDGHAKLEKIRRAKEEEAEKNKPIPQLNPHEDVHQSVTNYWQRLRNEALAEKMKSTFKSVGSMKPEEIAKEGAEWESEIERKAASKGFNNGYTVEYYEMRNKIQRAGSEYYKHLTSFKHLKYFMVNDFEVFAASEKDAIEIYTLATKR